MDRTERSDIDSHGDVSTVLERVSTILVVVACLVVFSGCGGGSFVIEEELDVTAEADGDDGATEASSVDSGPGSDAPDAEDAGRDGGEVKADGDAVVAPTRKVIFTSSETYLPNLGGLDGADAKCQGLADAAKLSGTFRAWLSDSKKSAKARLTHATVPYELVDGTRVADDWADLVSGALAHAVDLTEKGSTPPDGYSPMGPKIVWTATETSGAFRDLSPTGAKTSTCTDWTSERDPEGGPYASTEAGRWDSTGMAWTSYTSLGCSWGAPPTIYVPKVSLYCVEQ